MRLHVRVIEAKNLPKMDAGGLCDAYCKLSVGNEKFKTRKIDKSLNPMFRQDFHFQIEHFATDKLVLQVFDYDRGSRDDLVGDIEVFVKDLAPGAVIEQWYGLRKSISSQIRLWLHLSQEDDEPFVQKPFDILLTHVRVMEGKDMKRGDYCCSVSLGDVRPLKTKVQKNTERPDWQDEFEFIVRKYEEDAVCVNVVCGSSSVRKLNIPIKDFEIGRVVKKWFDLEGCGMIRLAFHVAPVTVAAFAGEEWDQFPPIASNIELYVRVVEARGIPKADVVGESDPYCVLWVSSYEKEKKRTRVVENCSAPKWNQQFQLSIGSLTFDQLVLTVYDYDGIGNKDDKLGTYCVPVRSLQYGVCEDRWVPLDGRSGEVHIVTYLGIQGSTPFVDQPFAPYFVGLIVVEALDIPKMDVIGLTDAFCTVKLSTEAIPQQTQTVDNSLHPIWDQRMTFMTPILENVSLNIEMMDEDPGSSDLISVAKVQQIQEYLGDEGFDLWIDMTPAKGVKKGGRLHLVIRVGRSEADLFNNMHFQHAPDMVDEKKERKRKEKNAKKEKQRNRKRERSKLERGKRFVSETFEHGLTLMITLIDGTNIPVMDPNGLADPYVIFKIKGKSGKEKSSIQYETLTPVWNEMFRLNVLDFDEDVLEITAMDYDKVGKDDLIGSCEVPVRQLASGVPVTKQFLVSCSDHSANINLSYFMAYPSTGHDISQWKLYMPVQLHLRVVKGESMPSGSLYVRLEPQNSSRFLETSKKEGPTPSWDNDFKLDAGSIFGDIKVTLYQYVKGKETKLDSAMLTVSDLELGSVADKCLTMKAGKVYFACNMEPQGVPTKLPPVQQGGYLCTSMTLNVRIIEAQDIQAMDRNGKSDPYILFYQEGKPKARQKTKIIPKTLSPVWNEEFHIPIKSIAGDVIHFSMRDHDDIGKDDKISFYDLSVATLQVGQVVDKWFDFSPEKKVKLPGRVHMIIHLCPPNGYAFSQCAYTQMVVNLMIEEAKDLANMDIGGKSDPYCVIGFLGDKKGQKTSVVDNSLSPQWFETFELPITHMEDSIDILMRDKDTFRDDDMAHLILPLQNFNPGYVYEDWFDMTPVKGVKKGGQIYLKIHIAEKGSVPFAGIPVPRRPEPVGNVCEVQIDLIRAFDLPGLDAGGKSDPYCRFTWVGRTDKGIQSRIIDNTCNPYWRQRLRMPIMSLGTDILRVEVMDHDQRGKDDKISMIDFPINSLDLGITRRELFALTPLEGRRQAGQLEMAIQVTQPGQVPFVDYPFQAYVLNVRVVSCDGLPEVAKSNLLCKVKMQNDARSLLSTVKENQSKSCVWNEDFQLTVTNHKSDNLDLTIENTETKKVMAHGLFSISDLSVRETMEVDIDMKPSGKVHAYVQIAFKADIPFNDIGLAKVANDHMTLYVKILDGTNIPKMDANGLADPYCSLALVGRKEVRKTEVRKKTLNPKWDQEFQFPILSYGTDQLKITLYDHDDRGADDKIGEWTQSIRDMEAGIVVDTTLQMMGKQSPTGLPSIHVIMHLANGHQPKYESIPFKPYMAWIEVCEAMEIENVDRVGKSDPFIELGMLSDVSMQRTSALSDTLSPQWFERFSLFITDKSHDVIQFVLKDDGIRNTKMATLEVPVSRFEGEYIYDEWFNMKPAGKCKKGGKLRLRVQISSFEVASFSYPEIPQAPLPPCTNMEFVVKLIEAQDVPIMDAVGSDPYCILKFEGHDSSIQKSRVIDNTLHPRWNQVFRMPVLSLNSNEFVLEMMDYDKVSKDDKISRSSLLLKTLDPGILYDRDVFMTPAPGVSRGGYVKMLYQLCAPGQVPFVSQPFVPYEVHVHLVSLANLPSPIEHYFCEVSIDNDIVPCLTDVCEGSGLVEFCNTFKFLMRDPGIDSLKLKLFKHVKKNKRVFPELVAPFSLPLHQFPVGQVCDQTLDIKIDESLTFQVRAMIHIVKVGETGFSAVQLPQRQPFIGQDTRWLHVHVKGCSCLPQMDLNGLCDPYCKLTMKKRKKQDKDARFVGLTRVVKRSLSPEFNQTFHIPIHSIDSDILKVSVWDYDEKTKDDKIASLEISLKECEKGTVMTQSYSLGGQTSIQMNIHISDFGQPAFVSNPFKLYKLNLRVWEAMEIPKADVTSKSDAYAVMKIKGGVLGQRTSAIDDSQTPQWYETFSFLLNNPATDELLLTLKDENIGADKATASMALQLRDFNIGYVYGDWHNLSAGKGPGGKIRLGVHIDLEDKEPFSGIEVPKPQPEPGEFMEFHVKVISGTNIRNTSFTDRIDPFCRLQFVGYKETITETRIIDNSHTPKWNQTFRMKVISLNSNVFRLSVHHRKKPKVSVGSTDIRLSQLMFGHVYDQTVNVGSGSVQLVYHLTRGGDMPFVEQAFVPLQVNVHIDTLNTENTLNHPYIATHVNDDRVSTVTTDQPAKIWRETQSFLMTNPTTDVVHLALCDVGPDTSKPQPGHEVCQFSFTTADIPSGTVVSKTLENDQGYSLSVNVQVIEFGQPVFDGVPLPRREPRAMPTMTLYCHVLEAEGLPSMDLDGSCDPFVKIKLVRQKKHKKGVPKSPNFFTRYVPKTLSPTWNQIYCQEIRSIEDDVIQLTLMDYDKKTANDKIGKCQKRVQSLKPGVITDEWIHIAGNAKLHVKWHLCAPQQREFVESPFDLYHLNVRVIEARDFKKADVVTKSDAYVALQLRDGRSTRHTRHKENSQTPQWYEEFNFLLTSHTTDSLLVTLKDDNIGVDKCIDHLEIQLGELEVGKTVSNWYKFSKKGEIRLLLQVVKQGEPMFADYVEPNEKVTGDFAMFHIKVIEARNLPIMDSGSSTCDAYCLLNFSDRTKTRTRTIENTLTPVWNQEFHYEIKSLQDDELILEVWDYDKHTKDDKVGTVTIRLLGHQFGTVVDEWYPIISASPSRYCRGEIHLLTHIAKGGQTSYQSEPFVPLELQVKVKHDDTMGYITEAHPYLSYKLDCDRTSVNGQSMGQYIYDINRFIVTEQVINKLLINLWNHKLSAEDEFTNHFVSIPLEDLNIGEQTTQTLHLTDDCTLEVSLCLTERGAPDVFALEPVPASFKSLGPRPDGFRVFVELLTYEGPETILGSGIAQQGCPNGMVSQQLHKVSSPLRNGLYFSHNIVSLNTDSLVFTWYSMDVSKPDKQIATNYLKVKNLQLGMVTVEEISLWLQGYKLVLRAHVAGPEQPPFMPSPIDPMILRVHVFEAVNIPKMDIGSKTDCYCSASLDSDIEQTRTKILNDSMTPQWDELMTFQLTTMKEKLVLRLSDENITKDKPISHCTVDLDDLKDGAPKCRWLKMTPEKGIKKGGTLCVAMQITPHGEGIDLRAYIAEPLPKDIEL